MSNHTSGDRRAHTRSTDVCDRGSAMLATILIALAVCIATVMAIQPILGSLIERQRAQAAADAAALAGVIDGRSGAVAVAVANGATLIAWSDSGDQVRVTVERHGHTAEARATDAP